MEAALDQRSYKIALIGLGGVAESHMRAYSQLAPITVSGGCDIDTTRRRFFESKYGLQTFAGHRDMLASLNPDVVCILTPAATHATIVEDVASRGIDMLCEKPLAPSPRDANAIVQAGLSHNVSIGYGSSYRFLPSVIVAREMIKSGQLGEIRVVSETLIGGAGISAQVELNTAHYPSGLPGGTAMGLVDHGIHMLDIFPWMLDSDVVSVFGQGNISGSSLRSENVALTFANGAMGYLLYYDGTFSTDLPSEGHFSWGEAWDQFGYQPPGEWHAHPGCVHVYGTHGALRIFPYANALYLFTERGIVQVELSGPAAPHHFGTQLLSLLEGLQSGSGPPVTAHHGVRAVELLHAVYQSAEMGCRILVEAAEKDGSFHAHC